MHMMDVEVAPQSQKSAPRNCTVRWVTILSTTAPDHRMNRNLGKHYTWYKKKHQKTGRGKAPGGIEHIQLFSSVQFIFSCSIA